MRLFVLFLAALFCFGAEESTWTTAGFEAFRKGSFDSGGANLYVSRKGTVQTVHRFDLNNDGYFDLIFNNTHDLAYTVSSYEYTFAAATRRPTLAQQFPGFGAVRILSTDLNGDGHPDLVIARGFDDVTRVTNSWVYWGGPNGWLDRFHTELFTPFVQDACVADLNGDHKPDLIFVSSSTIGVNRSHIYWNGPDGFSEHHSSTFETPGANGCLSGDLNNDGNADLVVTSATDSRVFWGAQHGLDLQASDKLPASDVTGTASFGNYLFVGMSSGIRILTVSGHGFHVLQSLSTGPAGRLLAADLNRDGIPDLVVTHPSTGRKWDTSSQIFWGVTQNNETRYSLERSMALPTLGAVDVAAGDIDGDGWPDIVFANSRSDLSFDVDSYVYWGGSNGFDVSRRTGVPTHGAEGVALVRGKVLFANSVTGHPIGNIDSYVYWGSPDGQYSTHKMQRLPTVGGYESCIADLNDDGYNDVVLVSSHEGDLGGSTNSFIYWGSKDGLSVARRSTVRTSGAIGCAVGDLDRDGYLDILFSNMDQEGVEIVFGGPDGFTNAREQRWPLPQPRFPFVADVNRDGYLDLLVPSLTKNLVIYFGSAAGINPSDSIALDGMYPVSEQVADLNGDGFPDIIVCNLFDETTGRYQGVHTQIYWGSAHGYSSTRRSELPSSGAHHAVVADFNRDGHLDIFVSNYQSEFTRTLNSSIYWGDAEGNYSAADRTELPNESAAGVVAADLNGDGWPDLAVSNHVQNGDHHTKSLIFWNNHGKFKASNTTALPTVGPHMMTGVDMGNVQTRKIEEVYTSVPYPAGSSLRPVTLQWSGTTPFGSRLVFEIRGADSQVGLSLASWQRVGESANSGILKVSDVQGRPWWQYRVHFEGGRAAWPTLNRVEIKFGRLQ